MRRIIIGATVLALTFGLAGAGPARGLSAAGGQLRVGSLELKPCPKVAHAWCGALPVPLDRSDPASPDIAIHFQWRPSVGRATGTIVAVEGGPGFPSIWTRDEYVPLFRPLLASHNLLLVDNRGTGLSAPVSCPALQHFHYTEPNAEWTKLVAACGRLLNHTYRRSDGTFVHASDLFGSANAARDLSAVLSALQTGPVDLYGDSYGTYFGQAFASRFPQQLQSLTLDGAYPVLDLNPWYPTTETRAMHAIDLVCERDLACSSVPGTASARLTRLVAQLRRHPVEGTTHLPQGQATKVRLDPSAIAVLLNNAAGDRGVIYRDLDAAVRAYFAHDAAPLLRLAAEGAHRGDSGALRFYSAGLYAAVTCNDYPAAFSLTASPARRRVEWKRAVARFTARNPDAYAPFTVREWLRSPVEDDEEYNACLGWPAPVPQHVDPAVVATPPLVPPSLPVLVLSSDLDSWTPAPGGKLLARQLGPSARWLLVPNTMHVSGLIDTVGCASSIVDAFVAAPGRLQELDRSCLKRVAEHHTAGTYVTSAADAAPAAPAPGNTAGTAALRLATVAVDTVGDVVSQDSFVGQGVGVGLRGGTFVATGTTTRDIELRGVRLTADAPVSGRVTWVARMRAIEADVTVAGPDGEITVHVTWNGREPHGLARVVGRANGTGAGRIVATLPAA